RSPRLLKQATGDRLQASAKRKAPIPSPARKPSRRLVVGFFHSPSVPQAPPNPSRQLAVERPLAFNCFHTAPRPSSTSPQRQQRHSTTTPNRDTATPFQPRKGRPSLAAAASRSAARNVPPAANTLRIPRHPRPRRASRDPESSPAPNRVPQRALSHCDSAP